MYEVLIYSKELKTLEYSELEEFPTHLKERCIEFFRHKLMFNIETSEMFICGEGTKTTLDFTQETIFKEILKKLDLLEPTSQKFYAYIPPYDNPEIFFINSKPLSEYFEKTIDEGSQSENSNKKFQEKFKLIKPLSFLMKFFKSFKS